MPGGAENRLSARIADVWGHFAPEVLCVSIVAAVMLGLRPPDSALMLTAPIAVMTVVLVRAVHGIDAAQRR